MLDQSFSAHNFDIIYGIESRKGNIDIRTMPDEYQKIIADINETKIKIADLRKKADNKSKDDLLTAKNLLKEQKESKQKSLLKYLEDVASIVVNSTFKFKLTKLTIKDNEVFTLDTKDHAQLFAIKQLQYNLRQTFKVKQANRHQILSNIKILLNSKVPVYIIRTDISSFFESIPQVKLGKMLTEDSLLSYKSKAFIKGILKEYENLKDTTQVNKDYGIPRGVGISSYLSELYMRDLDKKLFSRKEVIFYARYVDDIFMILSALPSAFPQDKDLGLQTYYNDLTNLFKEYELELKPPGHAKCQLIDLYTNDKAESTFDYLGYELTIKRKGKNNHVTFGMKQKKLDIIMRKIDNAIIHFETLSVTNVKQAYRDLMDSLNYITGNIALDKTKSGVKAGLYYSNYLLDDKMGLQQLTAYLHDKKISPYNKLNNYTKLEKRIKGKIDKIDFEKRWETPKFNRFSSERIKEIESWL